ncbi:HesA/MoeB/ThiF family protein [Geopsychrobacter electrodiphilus]|uniref:HesA/MoeB/ThiF family protein n=1 Tax=Geopsychrobacter electrodiphilus TaxID=225196 RepID=UPI0003620CDC|nr:ThiF family adenylyltransferase [Geopsychrobacter electrodiphilus]
MFNHETSVAMAERTHVHLSNFLIRADLQEDLVFALWTPSRGGKRFTALLHTLVLPGEGDRQIHGNASFNPNYFERICTLAVEKKCGIAFLHSHPATGWQGMSHDDIVAENKMASAVDAITNLPLVGMTVGSDGIWSARMWKQVEGRKYQGNWCHSVRTVGQGLKADFNDSLVPKPEYSELFKRTVTVWGKENHANLARLRVGIVGLGSVGSIVAETLARMGAERFSLIDFDEIQGHNLDRLLGATATDLGKKKVSIAQRQIKRSSTASRVEILSVSCSLAEEEGYRAALDCDVLFSCVDRPRARHILNHMAYSHLIPVIDGGIEVRFKNGVFSGVDWQLQTVAPGRPCMECLGTYNPSDVALEQSGQLDDPSYMKGLGENHRLKNNENVFPFSANLASLEVLQFVALVTGAGGIHNFGVQRYRYWPGIVEADEGRTCRPECDCIELEGQGDRYFQLFGRDLGAEIARKRQEQPIECACMENV